MAHFFDSVSKVMNDSCKVILSLVKGQEERWNLMEEASKKGLLLSHFLPMRESDWPGYVCKRNMHGKSFKNNPTLKHTQSLMMSHFFIFSSHSEQVDFIKQENPLQEIQIKLHENQNENEKSRNLISKESHVCPHCDKVLLSKRAYKQHVHMVHELKQFGENWTPNRPKNISCSLCTDRWFATQQDLWQHETNIHTEIHELENVNVNSSYDLDCHDEYIPCLICGQAVVNKDFGMQLHLESLKPAMGLDMGCMLCKKKFIEFRALYQHYKFCRLVSDILHHSILFKNK